MTSNSEGRKILADQVMDESNSLTNCLGGMISLMRMRGNADEKRLAELVHGFIERLLK